MEVGEEPLRPKGVAAGVPALLVGLWCQDIPTTPARLARFSQFQTKIPSTALHLPRASLAFRPASIPGYYLSTSFH